MNKSATALSTFALTMLIAGSIDSIRNLPASSLFGSTLIFFFVLAAVVFLIPAALISAELSASFPKQGGIYAWVKLAFGKKVGFLAIWLQWINTMVWYPTILSFIAATAAYFFSPTLATNPVYLVSVILVSFWVLTLLNLRGIHISAKFASLCAIIGLIIPMILIIGLAVIWISVGKPLQIHLNWQTLLPDLSNMNNWISLTAIMTAFLGMELATVHVRNVNTPQKSFPRAMLLSVVIILTTMMMGSLAIAFVIPRGDIHLVDGVIQTFSVFLNSYHLGWCIPILALMLIVGSLGGMTNWIISPAKGLLQASEDGFLPEFFSRQNRHGVAQNLLLTQAVLASVVCLAFLLMPSVKGSYWLLTDLSTELYIAMYVMMFISAIVIRHRFAEQPRPFAIPGKKVGTWITAVFGILGCAGTLVVGFFPPASINVGSSLHYEVVFGCGIIVMLAPVLFFYFYHYYHRKPSNI